MTGSFSLKKLFLDLSRKGVVVEIFDFDLPLMLYLSDAIICQHRRKLASVLELSPV